METFNLGKGLKSESVFRNKNKKNVTVAGIDLGYRIQKYHLKFSNGNEKFEKSLFFLTLG